MKNQKEAVFAGFESGKECQLSGKDLVNHVIEIVRFGLMNGEVEHSTPEKFLNNEKESTRYASALVLNWFKRDKRINGGIPYVPQTKRGPRYADNEKLSYLNKTIKALEGSSDPQAVELLAQIKPIFETELKTYQASKNTDVKETVQELAEILKAKGFID
jgi:hypothetical protein